MKGPDVVWYLCVAGFLFCTGALGVLIRRSPLIVLLSLEIMLNGANLALIAFSRHYAQGDGQIFALTVMAVAASEVVVGLGLIVAIARRKLDLDVDKLSTLRGWMIAAAWICLLSPLAAALLITLGGNRLSRRGAGYLATLSVAVSFVAAIVAFAGLLGDSPDQRYHPSTLWSWLTAGQLDFGLRILVDPLSVFMMLIVSGVGMLIVLYSIGYMEGDDEERRYFAYMALFVFSMLLLVQAGNLLILLVGWGLVGLSSYLLIGFWHERPTAVAAAKKAFVINAIGDATMALALFLLIQRTGSLNFEVVFTQSIQRQLGDQPDRARPARRRGRQVGAAAAAHVASGRDGGPDAGQRPDPRGDDGDRRRLPDRPHRLALRAGAEGARARRPGSARSRS